MNYTTAVFLINDGVRAVICRYEDHDRAKDTMFKTMDKSIKVDDLVIVPTGTRHGMTVVKVTAVDVDVDFDSPCEVKWIVSKVDTASYEKVLAQEADAVTAIRSAERTRKRNELASALLADVSGLKALPIATNNIPDDNSGNAA